jgi:hypothetical protein
MHCLEVIVARNDQAAGREAAHAFNDGDDRMIRIVEAGPVNDAFRRGYLGARKEDR